MNDLWTRDEMVLALNLYFQLPFGKLSHRTPEIIELANMIGRTPDAVAMRLSNYAACDPYIRESGRTGLVAGIKTCMPYWEEFDGRKGDLFVEAAEIMARMMKRPMDEHIEGDPVMETGMDKMGMVKQRVNQNMFRTMVLNNYNGRCAITGISIPELLVASHIIPWAENEKERLNPENGICLSVLYDKAFDRGFIGVDENYKIVLAEKLKRYSDCEFYGKYFVSVENQSLMMPEEHRPNPSFLKWHIEHIFDK